FRVPLGGVALFVALMILATVWAPARRRAVIALFVGALAYAAWGLDVYLPACAPHWGQRELFEMYVKTRSAAGEPIIAFRMNWLGEYFYSSNRIPAFGIDASRGASLARYVQTRVERGATIFFFVTEHSQVAALKTELG